MTPTETARTALQKVLDTLTETPLAKMYPVTRGPKTGELSKAPTMTWVANLSGLRPATAAEYGAKFESQYLSIACQLATARLAIEQALAEIPTEEPPTAYANSEAQKKFIGLLQTTNSNIDLVAWINKNPYCDINVPIEENGITVSWETMPFFLSPAPEIPPQLARAVLDLNAGWNAKEPERLIADRIDRARRLAKRVLEISDQFSELYQRNITSGQRFDDLVDALAVDAPK